MVTRLIPDARGTTCNQRIEKISGTDSARILRVPFRDSRGTLAAMSCCCNRAASRAVPALCLRNSGATAAQQQRQREQLRLRRRLLQDLIEQRFLSLSVGKR